MKPDRREFLVLGMGALAVATVPRAFRRRTAMIRRQLPVMGTVAEIAVRHPDEAWARKAMEAAFSELRRVDATMSRFRADSDVGRLNAAPRGTAVPVGDDTAEVLSAALLWAGASEGRFDPCLGRVAELWAVDSRTAPPTSGQRAGLGTGSHAASLEVERSTGLAHARLHDREAAVDLGGIAKGYGVDLAARAMRDNGLFHALVNVGGDLVALGVDEDGDPWKIGVRSPDHPDRIAHTLRVSDEAVATSGDYLQYFEYAGRRYHHLLDPATGEPRRTAMRSLTVAAPSCLAADAGATAAFGAGPDRADRVLGARASVIYSI